MVTKLYLSFQSKQQQICTILGHDIGIEEYRAEYNKLRQNYTVLAHEDITYLNECEAKDAEWICLPYYNGNDWKEVVRVVNPDTHMFIVREKIFIETHKEQTEGIKLKDGRDNDILGCIYLEHLPTETPKYEGDCDTRMTVYNTGAKYYRAALVFIKVSSHAKKI